MAKGEEMEVLCNRPKRNAGPDFIRCETFQIGVLYTKTLGKEFTFILFVTTPLLFSSFVLAASYYVALTAWLTTHYADCASLELVAILLLPLCLLIPEITKCRSRVLFLGLCGWWHFEHVG